MKKLICIALASMLVISCSTMSQMTQMGSSPVIPTNTTVNITSPIPAAQDIMASITPTFYGEPQILTTAQYSRFPDVQPQVTGIVADLKVSPTKITYFMVPSKAIIKGGLQNVIKTAIFEALMANGNGDVLVSLNTQIKYDRNGNPESITVTGYPATYVNFRLPGEKSPSVESEEVQVAQ